MKELVRIFGLTLLTVTPALAQIDPSISRSFSLGVSAGEFGYDAGVSVEAATPTFCRNRVLLRMKGSITWLEAHKSIYDRWATYKSVNASMAYNFLFIERARTYAEFGGTLIFPDDTFSAKKTVTGATCAVGVELFLVSRPAFNICYYFSGGITYARAYAEKIESKPRYSNGILFSNGFRFYF